MNQGTGGSSKRPRQDEEIIDQLVQDQEAEEAAGKGQDQTA